MTHIATLQTQNEESGRSQIAIAQHLLAAGFDYMELKDYIASYEAAFHRYTITNGAASQHWWNLAAAISELGFIRFRRDWDDYQIKFQREKTPCTD